LRKDEGKLNKDQELAVTTPTAGPYKPGIAEVRLVGTPDVLDAVLADLAAAFGEGWQRQRRKPSRDGDGRFVQYGALIVPIRRAQP
jgi:hypothetical protein